MLVHWTQAGFSSSHYSMSVSYSRGRAMRYAYFDFPFLAVPTPCTWFPLVDHFAAMQASRLSYDGLLTSAIVGLSISQVGTQLG